MNILNFLSSLIIYRIFDTAIQISRIVYKLDIIGQTIKVINSIMEYKILQGNIFCWKINANIVFIVITHNKKTGNRFDKVVTHVLEKL